MRGEKFGNGGISKVARSLQPFDLLRPFGYNLPRFGKLLKLMCELYEAHHISADGECE
jgi:hypothetical protein